MNRKKIPLTLKRLDDLTIGTKVIYRRLNGEIEETKTRCLPWVTATQGIVVLIHGHASPVKISNLEIAS